MSGKITIPPEAIKPGNKIRITADDILQIIQAIFKDDDVNHVVNDPSAPPSWAGKTIEEILNVEYYTFKHRPLSTQTVINKMLEETGRANQLAALNRAFCLLSLGNVERLFSKDVDMVVLSANLEYYIQTSKIKLLEYLIEDCNIAISGLRLPVKFGGETRQAVVIFGRPNVEDVQTATSFGEMALADVSIDIVLYPNAASYSDYTVSFDFVNKAGDLIQGCAVPLSSFSFVNTMTQKAVPRVGQPDNVGSINLSKAISFALVFDGYNNAFINYITDRALATAPQDGGESPDNNQQLVINIERGGERYSHDVVVKDHQIIVNSDTSNETHTLTLVVRGA